MMRMQIHRQFTRARSVVVATLALFVLAAGCRGSRPVARPGGGTLAAADTAQRTAARDSAGTAVTDSIARVAAMRDSLRIAAALEDSLRRVTAANPRAAADSAAKRPPVKSTPATKQCVLDFSESPPENRLTYKRESDGSQTTLIGGGFVGHCQGENNRIRADSLEQYGFAGLVNLFGNVVYEEPGKMRINAARATYFTREQRLFADGGVVATQLASGSTFTGPSIEYFRAVPGVRPASRLIAPNRPTLSVIEKDSTGKPGVPVLITGNTLQDEGDTLLYAWGNVTITRNQILAESDSASYDKVGNRSRLIRQARVSNNDPKQPFRLMGDTIDLFNKDRALERVLALHNGRATNQDFIMTSERIDLRLVDQKLDRAYASGDGQSKATTPQQELVADSIEIHLPGQRVTEVRAIGSAVTTGVPDTLRIKSEDRDVLRGDTVIAQFDTNRVVGDTSQQVRVRDIEARGNASSFFQVASKAGPTFPPAMNYLRAKTILIAFDTGAVRSVVADSSATGIYLEPAPDSTADSTARRGSATPPRRPPPNSPAPGRSSVPAPIPAPERAPTRSFPALPESVRRRL